MKPSFVYFDVGGVVVKDFSATNLWTELQQDLGIKPDQNEAFWEVWNRYIREICLTRDVETMLPILATELHLSIPPNYSLLEGFIKRFKPNPSIWPVIEQIKKNCRVGLLTNMYPRMLDAIRTHQLLPAVDWDVVIDSSMVGSLKPEPLIFELAQEKTGVSAEEILFVENSQMHIEAAQKLGWQTFLYDSGDYDKASRELGEWLVQ